MAEAPDYLRVIGTTALNGVATAAWVAAGELPAGKRRIVRTATTVAAIAVSWAALPPEERPFTWTRENGFAMRTDGEADAEKQQHRETGPENEKLSGRKIALAMGLVAVGVGPTVVVRKLEKRWLAGLQRAGHPRSYRALAWRMGLLNAVGSLPANLLEVQRAKDRAKR